MLLKKKHFSQKCSYKNSPSSFLHKLVLFFFFFFAVACLGQASHGVCCRMCRMWPRALLLPWP